ncbi:uncharacterized protein [Nicotiana sylvestris]|uniref:uncharacterized protein n=1 Tax=Nicotiana sylvestris TaxID=4096 RepID=UPI00388C90FD
MPGLGVDLVVHKLPIYPDCPPVQQKQRKFKTDISDRIKEEITKQLKTRVLMDEEDTKKIAFTTPWGATPYLLVYGTEAVIPAEVEIPSLRTIVEAEIEDNEWVKTRLEKLTLIDEKRMAAVCHGQLYQQRMTRAYNKKVRPRNFEVGQLVLRRILPHHQEAKGKFAPNWKGPYIIRKILPRGALYLGDIEGNDPETAVNADAVKMYYV